VMVPVGSAFEERVGSGSDDAFLTINTLTFGECVAHTSRKTITITCPGLSSWKSSWHEINMLQRDFLMSISYARLLYHCWAIGRLFYESIRGDRKNRGIESVRSSTAPIQFVEKCNKFAALK
jgi:hypothetical protein